MRTRLAFAVAVLLGAAMSPLAAATPQSMYETALARERAVRAEFDNDAAPGPAVLKEVRSIENAYLALVHHYPASGYSDDALWNAGRLALDAYAKYGEPADRETGLHLLNLLAASYPTSKLARRVADVAAGVPPATVRTPARAGVVPLPPATTAPAPAPADAPPAAVVNAAAPAPPGAPRHTIRKVSREVLPDVVRVTIEMDQEVAFHEERIDNPPRVFVDFPSTRASALLLDKTMRFDGDADLVRQIRLGRQPNGTTRVVLDAAGVTGYSIYSMYNPYRLVIDCARVRSTTAPVANAVDASPQPKGPDKTVAPAVSAARAQSLRIETGPQTLQGIRLSTNWGRTLPAVQPRAVLQIQAARAEADAIAAALPEPAAPLAPPALMPPPVKNGAPGVSMARQLGLGVSRIVIDPGHGGHDPGAKGKGVTEAEVVLDVALRLEKLLLQKPGTEVVLTRRTDDFIQLQDRTVIANRESADLFLSIHANASTSAQAHGVETYFLNFANNLSAAAVAARENAASGQAMSALPDFVKMIALNNKLDESRDFAGQVQKAMIEKLRGSNRTLKDLGVKQAPFVVLIGAAMPSILAEISFITNPAEAKLLKSGPYRQKIAEALLAAIQKYQTSLKSVSTIAHQ